MDSATSSGESRSRGQPLSTGKEKVDVMQISAVGRRPDSEGLTCTEKCKSNGAETTGGLAKLKSKSCKTCGNLHVKVAAQCCQFREAKRIDL